MASALTDYEAVHVQAVRVFQHLPQLLIAGEWDLLRHWMEPVVFIYQKVAPEHRTGAGGCGTAGAGPRGAPCCHHRPCAPHRSQMGVGGGGW